MNFDANFAGSGAAIHIETTSYPDLAWQLAYAVAQENTAIETVLSRKTYDRNAARSTIALKAIANPEAGYLDIYKILTNLFDYQTLIEMPSYLTVNFNPTSYDTSTTQYIDVAANKWQASYDILDVVTQIKTEKIAWDLREYMDTIPPAFEARLRQNMITDSRVDEELKNIFFLRGRIIELKNRRQDTYITQTMLEDIEKSVLFLKMADKQTQANNYYVSHVDQNIANVMNVIDMKKRELNMR